LQLGYYTSCPTRKCRSSGAAARWSTELRAKAWPYRLEPCGDRRLGRRGGDRAGRSSRQTLAGLSLAYKSAWPQPRSIQGKLDTASRWGLPASGSPPTGNSADPGLRCWRGRLTATCPCRACRYRACPYWACHGGVRRPCRRCHARCWIGPTRWCAGCWWTHRHRLTSRNQPSGMRWVGCSADGRPAPRPVLAPVPRPPRWSAGLRRPGRGQRRQGPPVVPPRPPGSGRGGEGIAR
jgi:hypothetical protein